MTTEQAQEVLRIALEGAAKQDLDDDRIRFMALHLAPLPFERTRRRVHEYVLAHKWLSSVDELLDAAGVSTAARSDLARAVHEGGELWPSLRSMSGWEFVPRGGPYPDGVALYCREAGLPLPTGASVTPIALAPGPATEPEEAPAPVAGDALRSIGTDLQQRKTAALRRSFEELRRPPTPIVPDREALPPVLREALVAADVVQESWAREKARLGAEVRAYEEMRGELAEMIRRGAPDNEAGKAVAVELLQRLLADPGYGLAAVAEVVRDALLPDGEVALKPEHGPNPDPFDEGPGPLTGLRLALRKG